MDGIERESVLKRSCAALVLLEDVDVDVDDEVDGPLKDRFKYR